MRNHISLFHLDLEDKQPVVVPANQRAIEQVILKFQPNLERLKQISNSIASCIAQYSHPYTVIANTATATLYNKIKTKVMQSLRKGGKSTLV